jgi:hypothetical protein
MHPPLNDETKFFWQAIFDFKAKGYGHWVKTSSLSPRPELVSKDYRFCRATCDNEAYWGFRSEEKSLAFQKAYEAVRWIAR